LRAKFGIVGSAATGFSKEVEPINNTLEESDIYTANLVEQLGKMGLALDGTSGKFSDVDDNIKGIGDSAEDTDGKINGIIRTMVDGVPTFTQAGKDIGDSYDNVKKKADEAKEKSDEFLIKMEEIASNERIKTIEATVELNIASLEADTKVAVAIIEGLSTSITATTDLLGTLFGLFTDVDKFNQGYIKRQIQIQNDNLTRELDMQQSLSMRRCATSMRRQMLSAMAMV
ncbi:MAG: hypothetical protein ACWGQW_22980, partial [bacterium]